MRRRTLVGRLALVQAGVAVVTLLAVVLLASAAATHLLGREQDRALLGIASTAAAVIAQELEEYEGAPGLIEEELAEHRVKGVRLEALDASGRALATVGEGPALPPVADGACADHGLSGAAWRVCQQPAGPYRIVAGRSRADVAKLGRLFVIALAAGALAVGLAAAGISRTVARRALAPMSLMTRRVAGLQPGSGERVGLDSDLAELDALSTRFDELLDRVDEALARERRFAAEASHELRTPLTVLRGEIEAVARGADVGDGAARRALAATDELIGLVEALLLLSRAQAPFERSALDVVNLADIVRDQVAALAGTRHPGRRVIIDAPDEVLATADERLIGRALANLVDNALKYSPADEPVSVSLTATGTVAVVSVRDHGGGVPEDLDDRIFEPFFRDAPARAQTPGYGLGLPLARAVARAHGGDVALVPGAGPGACFEMRLPILV